MSKNIFIIPIKQKGPKIKDIQTHIHTPTLGEKIFKNSIIKNRGYFLILLAVKLKIL